MQEEHERECVQVSVSIMIEPHPAGGYVAWPEHGEHVRMVAAEKWLAVQAVLSATAAYLDI